MQVRAAVPLTALRCTPAPPRPPSTQAAALQHGGLPHLGALRVGGHPSCRAESTAVFRGGGAVASCGNRKCQVLPALPQGQRQLDGSCSPARPLPPPGARLRARLGFSLSPGHASLSRRSAPGPPPGGAATPRRPAALPLQPAALAWPFEVFGQKQDANCLHSLELECT